MEESVFHRLEREEAVYEKSSRNIENYRLTGNKFWLYQLILLKTKTCLDTLNEFQFPSSDEFHSKVLNILSEVIIKPVLVITWRCRSSKKQQNTVCEQTFNFQNLGNSGFGLKIM